MRDAGRVSNLQRAPSSSADQARCGNGNEWSGGSVAKTAEHSGLGQGKEMKAMYPGLKV